MSTQRISADISLQKQKEYKTVNGTSYDARTPHKVIEAMEHARQLNRRIKIYYGDTQTGRDWLEENDTRGKIGRSTGTIKIPILIKNARSHGGGAILTHCIIKIKDIASGRVLYQADNYQDPKALKIVGDETYPFFVIAYGKIVARCLIEENANLFINRIS